ncbi:MAG: hypothetical protein JXA97_07680 [Anaerolineales bacterium]|nr:hypothetical protein [Anaerolineales bacterium]
MKHQLFEAWIFDEDALGETEQRDLAAHLADCGACRSLFEADRNVVGIVQRAGSLAPAPGFRERFEFRLEEQRRTRRLVQGLIITAVILAFLVAASFIVGGFLFTRYVPFTRAVTGVGQMLIQVGIQMGLMAKILGLVAGSFLKSLPQASLFAASIAGVGLTSLWLLSIYRVSSQPVRRF